ncbi:histidine phosphatase family protein [Litchfieldia alkalitelluris]|uniref:histidine phosphatase family protein n=1 Tax=Litchfieldia alkalitelluris TaxID=304268 RepID=UPI002E26DE93
MVSSTLKRAKETTEILSSITNVELKFEDQLQEYNNGVLAGLSRDEARVLYPLPIEGRPPHQAIAEGESELEFRFRAETIFLKILEDHKEVNRIALVSHGGMINNLLRSFCPYLS